MGGLIVLDFIDMKSRRDQQSVYQKVRRGCAGDRAKTRVLPIATGPHEMTPTSFRACMTPSMIARIARAGRVKSA